MQFTSAQRVGRIRWAALVLALLAVVLLAGQSGKAPARWAVVVLPIARRIARRIAGLAAGWAGDAAPETIPALDWLRIRVLTAGWVLQSFA